MTPEQARECMHDALDGELSESEQAAFEQALSNHADLRSEYEALAQLLKETRSLNHKPEARPVDLLGGVQQRLRERSGGRFYRDRFAETRGRGSSMPWMLALSFVVLIAVSAFLALDAGLFSN